MATKTVLITGASGALGSLVTKYLSELDYQTFGLSHHHAPPTEQVLKGMDELNSFRGHHFDLVINLAGAPIAGARWTERRKTHLLNSRVALTSNLIGALKQNNISITHFISGSAVGYYGNQLSHVTEESPAGDDFAAELCASWETAAQAAHTIAQCITVIRTGLVLLPNGGFLKPQKLATNLGLGAVFGDGKQGISWIDYRDWLRALDFIISNKLKGPLNLSAPDPVDQRHFSTELAKVLNRPRLLTLPKPLFLPLGEMKAMFIGGQFVMPNTLLKADFKFDFPKLKHSLDDLVDNESN